MGRLRTSRSQPSLRHDTQAWGPRKGIPGYAGYIPSKKAETLSAGLVTAIQAAASHERSTLCHDQQQKQHYEREVRNFRANPESFMIPRKHYDDGSLEDKRGNEDIIQGYQPAAGDYQESRILNSDEAYYEEPPLGHNLKAQTNLIHYTGYIPGKKSENVFGNGWTKENLNSVSAHERTNRGRNRILRSDPLAIEKSKSRLAPRGFYDTQQNRRLKQLYTRENTAVERVESDNALEIPLFFTHYQDMKRGWSGDPWVGSQIDAAGREAPVNRQESWNAVHPPNYTRAPKYAGYIPAKHAENVFAERQATTESICQHRREKNAIRILQR